MKCLRIRQIIFAVPKHCYLRGADQPFSGSTPANFAEKADMDSNENTNDGAWRIDLDEIFIEEVKRHPILYDLSMEDYKNIKKKDRAWREVALRVNLEDAQCRKRWKGLRDSYKRCKRSEIAASGSAAAAPKPKWKYYDTMTFLDQIQSSRRTVGNISHDENAVEFEALNDDLDCTLSEDLTSSNSNSQEPSFSKRGQKQNEHTKKFNQFLDVAAASITQSCSAFVSRTNETDSTTMLFASLAKKVVDAQMPQNFVNRLERKVSEIVFLEIENFLQNY